VSRRPDPLEKRLAKGNTSGRPLPESPPARVDGVPDAPAWLTGHAVTAWHRIGGLLARRGQLSLDTEPSLIALCVTWAEWVELADDLQRNGRFQRVRTKVGADGKRGSFIERVRPAVAAFADADRRLKGWLVEFGLTDASRGKVEIKPAPPADNDPLKRYGLQ